MNTHHKYNLFDIVNTIFSSTSFRIVGLIYWDIPKTYEYILQNVGQPKAQRVSYLEDKIQCVVQPALDSGDHLTC